MSILIIGSEGSMGKRYQAILKYLGKSVICVDNLLGTTSGQYNLATRVADGIIIATPTDTHFKFLIDLIPLQKPLLCEKPVSKEMAELEAISDHLWEHETPFRMMYQYSVLTDPKYSGDSHYNYFRHGSDGLVWDCLQVIGLSKREPALSGISPIWDCAINGEQLALSHMDKAYVDYVDLWFKSPTQDFEEIKEAHYKTHERNTKWQNSLM